MQMEHEHVKLALKIEEPCNDYAVIHLHNRTNIYHITRQILLDSALTQDSCCFFYHIVAKTMADFNNIYGSFACIISRNDIEADVYLNVDQPALEIIIAFISTGDLPTNLQDVDFVMAIDNLASMFGMAEMVHLVRVRANQSQLVVL